MASRSLGTLTIDLVAKIFGFEKGMDKAAREAAKSAKSIKASLGIIGGAVLAAGAAAGATAAAWVRDVADLGVELDKMSKIANATTQEFQKWSYGADLVGISQEKLADQLKDFVEKVGEFQQTGGGGMKDFFEQIAPKVGLTAEAFRNLSGPQAMQLYFDALEKANLSQEQMSFYLESMASDTTALIPLLRNGGEGFKKWGDEAEKFGAILDDDTRAAIVSLREQSARLDQMLLGLKVTVAKELLPAIADFAELLGEDKTQRVLADVASLLGDAAAGAVRFADEIRNASKWVGDLSKQMDGLTGVNLPEWLRVAMAGITGNPVGAIGAFARARATTPEPATRSNEGIDFTLPAPGPSVFGKPYKVGGTAKHQAREVDQLTAAYESLMKSARERLALLGTEGELAKIIYQTQQGDLKGLSDERKNEIIAIHEQIDAKQMLLDEIAKEEEARDRERQRVQEGLEYGKQVLDDLRFEFELMKMTNAERATAIQLRGMEAEAVQKYGAAIAEMNEKIEAEMERARLVDDIRYEFSGFFEDIISGSKSAGDAFKSLIDGILDAMTRLVAKQLTEQLFGSFGTTQSGSSGGWIQALAGLFGGGKAGGGWAAANTAYEINERGFETASVNGRDYLLTGNKPVEITPNHRLGRSGGGVVQNFYNPVMSNAKTQFQIAQEQAVKAQRAMARS